jgi:SAM-dependent methyltransferase
MKQIGAHRVSAVAPRPKSDISPYNERAVELATLYESTTFEQVHRGVIDLIPPPPSRVLDVGAGSGRDAAALARRGYQVVAVEPSDGLRREAEILHPTNRITWVKDSLPDLGRLDCVFFDFILVSAVWMYIPAPHRDRAMHRLAALLVPLGFLVITLRHGPADPARGILAVDERDVTACALTNGLVMVRTLNETDALRRAGISWSTLVFRSASLTGATY